jgi:hypothetical protein
MLQAIIEDITVTAREASGSEIERQGQIPDGQAHHEAALRPEQYQIGADRGSDARDAAGKLAHTQRTIGDTVETLLAKKDAMTPERLKLLLSVVQLDREVSAATGSASSHSLPDRRKRCKPDSVEKLSAIQIRSLSKLSSEPLSLLLKSVIYCISIIE